MMTASPATDSLKCLCSTQQLEHFAAAEQNRPGDLEITGVGREAKMPWERDGRRWHTQLRVGRKGEPCRWDGRILERVVDRIHEPGDFSPTDWSDRSVVEIAAEKKSDGWFFHTITGETWLLKLRFRVARGSFRRDELLQRLPLKTLNQMDELPIYGNDPRVRCKTFRGPWQEVQINAYSLEEIDTPEFWGFLEQAVQSFFRFTRRAALNPEDHMPWKKLGRKWHFLRKGFPLGKRVLWDAEVLEELCELLSETAPDGQFLWNNQVLVHFMVRGQQEPWATLQTKRPDSLNLMLRGPKGCVTFGRVARLARARQLDASRPAYDALKLAFRTLDDLRQGDLREFLKEHVDGVNRSAEAL